MYIVKYSALVHMAERHMAETHSQARASSVGGKKGSPNRTDPNQRIIPDGTYGNFRLLRYRVLPPSPNRTNECDIYCLFYHYFFSFY